MSTQNQAKHKKVKIPRSLLRYKRCEKGVYFGEKPGLVNDILRNFDMNCSVVKPMYEEGHIGIIGGSGIGKTNGIGLPTICCTWSGQFCAIDLKGDLLPAYTGENSCEKVKVFSLRGETDCTYDPFEFIRNDGEDNLVSNMRELVSAILPLPANIHDDFWIKSAREYLTAGLLYYYGLKLEFIEAVGNIMTTPPIMFIRKINKCNNPMIRIFVNNFLGDKIDSDSKLLMGVGQEITNRLSVMVTDRRVSKALSQSEKQIRWTDLETHNIFLSIPEDRLDQYSPVTTMMLTQLVRSLERRPEKHSPEGKNQRPIMLFWDELPRLGKLDVLQSAVSTLRSKSVTMCLLFQSLAQLNAIYGKDVGKIILDNCAYLAVLGVNDVESQRYFSERTGKSLVQRRSRSTTYDVAKQVTGYSDQVSESRDYAIQPNEFATLDDVVLFSRNSPQGYERVRKNPYYDKSDITKFYEGIENGFSKIKSFFSSCLNGIKSLIYSGLVMATSAFAYSWLTKSVSSSKTLQRAKQAVPNAAHGKRRI